MDCDGCERKVTNAVSSIKGSLSDESLLLHSYYRI